VVVLDAATLAQTYDGTTRLVTATTTPAGLAHTVTYDGSPTPPSAAGSYAVVATVTDANHVGSASGTLVVAARPVVVHLDDLEQVADGGPKTVIVTTTPAGLATSVTYDGSAIPPSAPGSYAVMAQVVEPNHAGSASATLRLRSPVTGAGSSGASSSGGSGGGSCGLGGGVASLFAVLVLLRRLRLR
jgi:uncharacterized membrane protein YgcG